MTSRKDQDSAKWMRPLGKDSLSSDRFIKPTLEARRAYEESRYTPNEEASEAPKRAPAIVISQTGNTSNTGSAPNVPAAVISGSHVSQTMQRNAGAVSAPAAGGTQMANAVPMQNHAPSVPVVAVPGSYVPQAMQRNAGAVSAQTASGVQMANAVPIQNHAPSVPVVAVPGSYVPQAMQRNAGAVSAQTASGVQMANATQTANTMPMQRKTNTENTTSANGISPNAPAAPTSGRYRSQTTQRSAGAVSSQAVGVTQAASCPQSANIVPMHNPAPNAPESHSPGRYPSQTMRRSADAVNTQAVGMTQAASCPQSASIVQMQNPVQATNAVPVQNPAPNAPDSLIPGGYSSQPTRKNAGAASSDEPEAHQSLSEISHSVRDNALQTRQAAREAAKNEPSESSAAASMSAAPRKRRSRLSERNANQEEKPVSLSSATAAPVHDTLPPAPPQIQPTTPAQPDSRFYQAEAGTPVLDTLPPAPPQIQPITPAQPDSRFYQAEAGTPKSEKPDLTSFESETPNETDIAEDEDESDAVPSEQMAQPAPVQFGDVQPPSRKRSVIWGLLVAVVLLAAAALALLQTGVLSKLLGKELPKLPPLFPTAAQEAPNVEGAISAFNPESTISVTNFTADKTSAVAPAVINFSVRTDSNVTDIRLLSDGNSSVLIDSVIGLADTSGKLWEFSVRFSSAFSGDVRVYIRDTDGIWQASGASMTLNIR